MPIRRTSRHRSAPRLSELSFREVFAFLGSWWRPELTGDRLTHGFRFSTWPEYFTVYEAVRDELLAQESRRPWAPFAEHARARFRAGQDPADARLAYEAARDAYAARTGQPGPKR